jgi:Tim44-like domain
VKRRALLTLAAAALAAALSAPDVGARPGGGQSFSSPSRPSFSPSPSRPSYSPSPSRPSYSPSPSRPSYSPSPSRPSYSPAPYTPSPSSSPDTSTPSSGDDRSMSGSFLPVLFLAALAVLVLVLVMRHRTGMHRAEWESGLVEGPTRRRSVAQRYNSLVAALASIRQNDPEFSFVLFEDFLYALYTEAHTARGRGRLAGLSPYLSPSARGTLEALGARPVETVIVGALRVEQVEVGGLAGPTEVTAVLDTNYAERDAQGAEQAYYASERWKLARPAGAHSRPPERARIVDCPSCGAPLDKLVGGVCGYCNKNVERGDLDWTVVSIDVLAREARPPILTGETVEAGTDDPTLVAPDVQQRWKALTARDPALDWRTFSARLGLVFTSFHEAWTAREPLRVRPFLSDSLFQSQLYWIDAYKRQGLVNRTDGAHIVSVHLCRVVSDARYDAVTVRVFATGLDYTVNEAGEVVGGDRERPRPYSEYWTLIRGVDRSGAPRATPECPSCGAPLDVNMAGSCNHCRAKVTAGEFDWVLSRIEQDEVYTG